MQAEGTGKGEEHAALQVEAAATRIRQVAIEQPRVGLVLGSGLGALAEGLEERRTLEYAELPGFPEPTVGGHAGRLWLGRWAGVPMAVMQGRAHYYERGRVDAMKVAIRALRRAGVEILVLTNAAGSLREEHGPGSLLLIADHINLVGVSPLFAETGSERFVDMSRAYDPALRSRLRAAAEREGIALPEAVYLWMSGPQFETPAEIRAARLLGADAVGMSTVPEVILARHAGLRVAALSAVTNLAAGMAAAPLSHAQTMTVADRAALLLERVLSAFLAELSKELC